MAAGGLCVFADLDAIGTAVYTACRVRRSVKVTVHVQDFLRSVIHSGYMMPLAVIDVYASGDIRRIETRRSPGNVVCAARPVQPPGIVTLGDDRLPALG